MDLLAPRLGQSALVVSAMNGALWVMIALLLAFPEGHYTAGATSLVGIAGLFATLLGIVRALLERLAGVEDRTRLVV